MKYQMMTGIAANNVLMQPLPGAVTVIFLVMLVNGWDVKLVQAVLEENGFTWDVLVLRKYLVCTNKHIITHIYAINLYNQIYKTGDPVWPLMRLEA
jgi:hypothetical protein